MAGSFFDRSPEQLYFQSLEEVMIKLRGAPLQLSPDDWQVSKEWFRDEMPLELVEEAIRDVVERRRQAEKEIPSRLRYYRQAVEKAWCQVEALTAPGKRSEATDLGVKQRLSNLASALGSASWLASLAEQLRTLEGESQAIEDEMMELDKQMICLARSACNEAQMLDLTAKVETALKKFGDRMPESEKAAARRRLEVESLRRMYRLPVLSLFAPEATTPSARAAEGVPPTEGSDGGC